MFMPTVGELAELQEKFFLGKMTENMHPGIPTAKVVEHGSWVQSIPIQVGGKDSHLAIRGKIDLLLKFEDGSYGIIDCKMQARSSDKSAFYTPQLEAYAFAFENPAKGEPKKISMLGIYSWSLDKAWGDVSHGFGYRVNNAWYPVERNPAALQDRFADFISLVNGECPPSKESCEQCRYVAEREFIIKGN